METLLILYPMLLFMIAAAIIAIETHDLLSSVIAVGAVGLGLSVVFLFLGAPDLAIVQVVVEALTLVLLLKLVVKREDVTESRAVVQSGPFATAAGLFFCGVFFVCSWWCFDQLRPFGSPIFGVAERFLQSGIRETGAGNLVTAVLLDYRAYDTLGEATVIFAAIIGALAVLRKVGRRMPEGTAAAGDNPGTEADAE